MFWYEFLIELLYTLNIIIWKRFDSIEDIIEKKISIIQSFENK